MPTGHQSVDMLINGRYFDNNHSNSRNGRNDNDDDDNDDGGDLRDVTDWPPLMKGEFILLKNITMYYHLYYYHHHISS
jgi:hypothetical protein